MSAINFGRNFFEDGSYSNITENEKYHSIYANKLLSESSKLTFFCLLFFCFSHSKRNLLRV